ncbi:MAG TPA: ABC transporter, partial [Marmoricola sp.]
GGLARPWASALRRASTSRLTDLEDRLDHAVGGVDLGVSKTPLWTRLVRAVQWLLVLAALAGAVWLGALAVTSYLKLSEPPTPEVGGIPVPTALLIGGVALGLLLALLCRVLVGRSARKRARRADRRLRAAVDEVTDELVVTPLRAELDAHQRTVDGLRVAGA